MNRLLKVSTVLVLTVIALLAFQNCAKVAFTEIPVDAIAGASSTTPSCRIDYVNTTKDVKVLFLIDTSGSNAGNNGGPGTDMEKKWRLATLNAFINQYSGKPNFSFAFAAFKEDTAFSFMKSGDHGIFSNKAADISQAVEDFKNTLDHGSTPYDKALVVVNDIIGYDQKLKSSKEVSYVVVMISDGSPSNASYTSKVDGMENLAKDVTSIMDLAPKQISFNTVFIYNDSVPTASQKSYLQKIASLGQGAFLEASSQQTLQITDSILAPKEVCDQ